jgi:hypothetical protein
MVHYNERKKERTMSTIITGIVTNGVIVPSLPLREGANVEIQVKETCPEALLVAKTRLTPSELRRMPREQRQVVLAAAAEIAEPDYRASTELTAFDAFSEEDLDGDESESR